MLVNKKDLNIISYADIKLCLRDIQFLDNAGQEENRWELPDSWYLDRYGDKAYMIVYRSLLIDDPIACCTAVGITPELYQDMRAGKFCKSSLSVDHKRFMPIGKSSIVYIADVAVNPKFRSCGFGTAILQDMVNQFSDRTIVTLANEDVKSILTHDEFFGPVTCFDHGGIFSAVICRDKRPNKGKVYFAASCSNEDRTFSRTIVKYLRDAGWSVYAPFELKVPNAWDLSQEEWAEQVFKSDLAELDAADVVFVLTPGRKSTAGTNFEQGYAYAKGKQVVVLQYTDQSASLMSYEGSSTYEVHPTKDPDILKHIATKLLETGGSKVIASAILT